MTNKKIVRGVENDVRMLEINAGDVFSVHGELIMVVEKEYSIPAFSRGYEGNLVNIMTGKLLFTSHISRKDIREYLMTNKAEKIKSIEYSVI